ncbi:MAG TPA: CehA/McbA family metallohydrolase [Armatimonadaceae bacterium]|nr:CehA/McbA family metallohydrolase [Armatimonadaceae bacterium]
MTRANYHPACPFVAALVLVVVLVAAVAASAAARRSSAPAPAAAAALDRVIVVEGRREPGEASVSTAAMKYLPFDVPDGVTKITIRKEFDHGPDPAQKNTVDLGLFDPRGYGRGGPGFRAWQGGVPQDLVISGTAEDSSPHGVPGLIPAGRWHLAQYFLKSTPAGLGYKYTVTLSFDGPKPPKDAPKPPAYSPGVLNPKRGWYAGNLHTHTLHSDGARTLPELTRRVRDAGFDFMASTEHNSPTAHFRFPEAARAAPGLLLLHGDELTTPGGHANIIGQRPGHWFDFRMDPGDGRLPAVIDEAHRQGALFVVNHPFATCTSCTWKHPEADWAAKADAIEVWNGAWSAEDREAVDNWDRLLKQGSRLRAWGGTDYHRGEEPMVPAALVYADNLSRDRVLDGMKRGRVLLSERPRGPRVFVTPAGRPDALPGDTVRAGRDAATLPVTVRVTGGRGMTVRLVWTTGETRLPTLAGDDETLAFEVPLSGAPAGYVRAELLRPLDLVAALTNPLFIDRR